MQKTKLIFLSALCSMVIFTLHAQNQKFSFNELYEVSNSPTLRISASDGHIDVFPSDKNEIEVFYIVERNKEILDITRRELEEDFTIEVLSGRDFLDISIKEKYKYKFLDMDWRNRINISLEIYTPFKTSCDLNCSDGNIRIKGLQANQKLHTSDGDVEVFQIIGDVYAKTSDGDVFVRQVDGDLEPITSDGDIEISHIEGDVEGRTSDGDVELQDITGNVYLITSDGDLTAEDVVGDLELRSSDGDIRLNQTQGRNILTTSDGSISFRDLKGSLKARTSDGQIRGNMLSLDASLELKTSDGNIAVTLPGSIGLDLLLRAETIRTQLDNFSGTSKDHLIEGRVNGGGRLVSLHASDGSVSLTYED